MAYDSTPQGIQHILFSIQTEKGGLIIGVLQRDQSTIVLLRFKKQEQALNLENSVLQKIALGRNITQSNIFTGYIRNETKEWVYLCQPDSGYGWRLQIQQDDSDQIAFVQNLKSSVIFEPIRQNSELKILSSGSVVLHSDQDATTYDISFEILENAEDQPQIFTDEMDTK